jgi:hypothetical protein
MTIGAVSNYGTSLLTELQARSKNTNSTAASSTDSISLSTDSINFALNGEAPTTDASNQVLLSYNLNADILNPSKNLGDVGRLIDGYTSSLASSNVYDSTYTTPSAKFLSDLADLKAAASNGNQSGAEAALAAEKADAPESVGLASSTALAKGDTSGLAALDVEATANISDYLKTQGYSSRGADAEASAIIINGLSENAVYSGTYTATTRLQQITNLAFSSSDNGGSASNGLFNIYESLEQAKSGTAIDQSLTSLDSLYGGGTSSAASPNKT